MIRDITIGQYYPANSLIHRLDPRVKLLGTIVFVVTVFFVNDLVGLILATVRFGCSHRPLKSSAEIYVKGFESHFHINAFYGTLKYFPDSRNRTCPFWNF